MDEQGDHVKMGNTESGGYVLFCLHCGERYVPVLPISVEKFSEKCDEFFAAHKDCRPGEQVFTVEQMMRV